jgi:lipopolysaccharide export system permease protein
MLERTVRDSRSDREMSARDLIQERAQTVRSFDSTSTQRADRFRTLGASASEVRRLIHGESGLGPLVAGAWARLVGRDAALVRPDSMPAGLRIETDLWRMERDGLRRRIAGLSVEIHKKFSLPLACVVFVLIGAPLGMRVRRAGPAVAFVSIGFFLFYYLCLVGGEELANRLLLPPWMAMWLPNVVLGGWGLVATLRTCELLPRGRPRTAAAR